MYILVLDFFLKKTMNKYFESNLMVIWISPSEIIEAEFKTWVSVHNDHIHLCV